jgi:predicted nucleic acid-binding Zn ribbon protein
VSDLPSEHSDEPVQCLGQPGSGPAEPNPRARLPAGGVGSAAEQRAEPRQGARERNRRAPEPAAVESAADGESGADASAHDPKGLQMARSVAARVAGVAHRRKPATPTRRRPPGTAELSGARPDARDPALVGAAVERLVEESGWATEVAVHGVFGRWASIVGQEVAAHCAPESYQEGHLGVRTDSTAWATQLRLLAPTVVRRLNEELGDGTVLRIDVSGPATPSWRKGRRSVRGGRGPRDTYG